MKIKTLAEKYNYTCYWCKYKFPLEDLTRDHIIPNTRTNKYGKAHGSCVLACIVCNHNRGNKPFHIYKQELEDEKKNRKIG